MAPLFNSLADYAGACQGLANGRFQGLSVAEVAAREDSYNSWPDLGGLKPPRTLLTLEDSVAPGLEDRAKRAILEGRVFWEHTAAGEATRLKLGSKYLITPAHIPHSPEYLTPEAAGLLPTLRPLSMGLRHLGQGAFEIKNLAREAGLDPGEALRRQKVLLIVGEGAADAITADLGRRGFLGFDRRNFLFMVQASFHGLTPGADGAWRFDPSTARRLHNHGQMALQKTMERQVFRLGENGGREYLGRGEYFGLLAEADDLVSYNIEDLKYLTGALDFTTIGLALELGERGYGMTMEIVPNNPQHPVKGGLCAFDPALGRDVVIESFRLPGLEPARITHLNKNFNHYPHPAKIFGQLAEKGLFMPVAVKDGALYFQPVQGDLNLLAQTAFLTRRVASPLSSWKAPHDTAAAVQAMRRQDGQPGFAGFWGD